MKLAPPPLDIGPDKGFENTDLFGYKDFGERFARIVEALSSAVIVLDGPWGSGKTTFTQQWAGLLRKRGHAVVQFDAFANDYHDDAFVALAGAIHACSKDEKLEGLQKLKALFLKSAAGVTKALPPIATRVGINLVTLGALSSAEVSKLVEAIQSANSSQLEKRIAKAYENTQAINEFRDRLTELARELARSRTSGTEETDPANKTQQQKLVFIIDELDRCKPTFALNLLERIKHLFSVDEIVFVLVAHLPQLARMVENVAEREELTETGLGSTARCCGRRRHRQANSVRVCSPTSRRVASLRPRSAGLTALTSAPRTLVQTGSCRRCPLIHPLNVVVAVLSRMTPFPATVDREGIRGQLRGSVSREVPSLACKFAEQDFRGSRRETGPIPGPSTAGNGRTG